MIGIRSSHPLYRSLLKRVQYSQNRDFTFNYLVISLNRHIFESYILLIIHLLTMSVCITCLIQLELGMFCLIPVFILLSSISKVVLYHLVIQDLSTVRFRFRGYKDQIMDFPVSENGFAHNAFFDQFKK